MEPESQGKRCNKCRQVKPYKDFPKNAKEKDGHFRWCKQCWNEARRKRYAVNPEPFRRANKRSKAKKKFPQDQSV